MSYRQELRLITTYLSYRYYALQLLTQIMLPTTITIFSPEIHDRSHQTLLSKSFDVSWWKFAYSVIFHDVKILGENTLKVKWILQRDVILINYFG